MGRLSPVVLSSLVVRDIFSCLFNWPSVRDSLSILLLLTLDHFLPHSLIDGHNAGCGPLKKKIKSNTPNIFNGCADDERLEVEST